MYKCFIIILILLYIWAFFIEPNLITIKRYKLNKFKNKKIIFVSDFHISKFDKNKLKRIVKIINRENPDLVISGGDYIKGYSGKNTLPIEEQVKELTKIKAPIISVLGNHDGMFDKFKIKKVLEDNGIKVLMNSNIKTDDIYICGVEDLKTGNPNVDIALENTESPRILISHSPDIYYDINQDIDLILAGHVHGGQVRIPFYGSIIVPSKYSTKFACGFFSEKNDMIVTKGVGTSILTVRFCCLPEIVVIE